MTGKPDNWLTALSTPLRMRMDAVPSVPLPLPAIPRALEAALLLGLLQDGNRTLVWITDGPQAMDIMARNLRTLGCPDTASLFSYPPGLEDRQSLAAVFAVRDRLSALASLSVTPPRPLLLLTCIEAILQPCPPPDVLRRHHRLLKVNTVCDRQELTVFLQQTGHRFSTEVTEPGQVAIRGGIMDAWPIRENHPFRIEFFDNLIESIRIFDPVDQRSVATRTELHLGMAVETGHLDDTGQTAGHFHDYLPENAAIVWSRYAGIERHLALLAETDSDPGAGRTQPLRQLPWTARATGQTDPARSLRQEIFIPAPESMPPLSGIVPDDIRFIEGTTAPSDDGFQPDAADRQRRTLVRRLAASAATGSDVRIFFNTAGALTHFRKSFANEPGASKILCESGWLSDGFHLPALGILFIGEDLLYGGVKNRRPRPVVVGGLSNGPPTTGEPVGERLSSWNDLQPGDLVVHAGHGIGRYLGLQTFTEGETIGDFMIVTYADDARLLVPASQAHLLSRYVGAPRHGVRLHRLGGTRWNRERHAAARAIEDLAAAFVEIQAARQALPGYAFSADTPWFHDFETAFPFPETVDQTQAIADVLRDMEAPRPMDRLICGDAGYGKTEVAMRAAFKAVMDGKQVAVFVPTTVLAQQHFYTFSERMAPYPVTVEMLSRFSSADDRRRVRAGLLSGAIDIVIGTHALLNRDLAFHDLGLVIIDEEQRFGVMHKERFKHIRRMLDVLTLTATPIPRTLYLSLTGVRELSAIRTPPRDRLAIETEITEDRNDVLRHAILRELRRDGQVYYLHNRIQSIERMHERLSELVPEARIETAHGRMAAQTLSDKMRRFSAGRFDLLLCTTIIESGVDIPSVNTIIIDRADRFGLAELYQLRGRVGRSGVRAYALLLLPKHGLSDPLVRKRVGALKEYAHPGAGFELALRDLEIRGAGNLLGSEQSGHISAIGFNLYCQLLQRTVAQLKGESAPPLVEVELRLDFLRSTDGTADSGFSLPVDYIDGERERMRIYRRIAEAVAPNRITALRDELRDRFGPLPKAVQHLLTMAELRIAAAAQGVRSIETDGNKIMIRRADGYFMPDKRFPRLAHGTIDERLDSLRGCLESCSPASGKATDPDSSPVRAAAISASACPGPKAIQSAAN